MCQALGDVAGYGDVAVLMIEGFICSLLPMLDVFGLPQHGKGASFVRTSLMNIADLIRCCVFPKLMAEKPLRVQALLSKAQVKSLCCCLAYLQSICRITAIFPIYLLNISYLYAFATYIQGSLFEYLQAIEQLPSVLPIIKSSLPPPMEMRGLLIASRVHLTLLQHVTTEYANMSPLPKEVETALYRLLPLGELPTSLAPKQSHVVLRIHSKPEKSESKAARDTIDMMIATAESLLTRVGRHGVESISNINEIRSVLEDFANNDKAIVLYSQRYQRLMWGLHRSTTYSREIAQWKSVLLSPTFIDEAVAVGRKRDPSKPLHKPSSRPILGHKSKLVEEKDAVMEARLAKHWGTANNPLQKLMCNVFSPLKIEFGDK